MGRRWFGVPGAPLFVGDTADLSYVDYCVSLCIQRDLAADLKRRPRQRVEDECWARLVRRPASSSFTPVEGLASGGSCLVADSSGPAALSTGTT